MQRRIELITNVLKLIQPSIGDYRDINAIFERNYFIMNDTEERQTMYYDVTHGIIKRAEYRMKFYNETLEEAIKAAKEAAAEYKSMEYSAIAGMSIEG